METQKTDNSTWILRTHTINTKCPHCHKPTKYTLKIPLHLNTTPGTAIIDNPTLTPQTTPKPTLKQKILEKIGLKRP